MQIPWYLTLLIVCTLLLSAAVIDRYTPPAMPAGAPEAARSHASSSGRAVPPTDFFQDGCTLFPDSVPFHDFKPACLAHDIQYWAGGPIELRREADIALREDIKHTGPLGPALAWMMYGGVRVFGNTPLTKAVDANWGYGWNE